MTDLLEALDEEERSRAREAEQPRWANPMLATLTHEAFSDAAWIYERKLDGVRLLAFRRNGSVRLVSRNRKDRNATWPEIADALEVGNGADVIVDGEVVAFEGEVTSFSRLQERMQIRDEEEARKRSHRVRAYYYLFDLLHLDGHDVTKLPLRTRKRLLKQAMRFEDPVRYTPHRNEEGQALLEKACRKGWEGLIAKRADSEYVHSRSRKWLKLKCVERQELVVGGWTDPEGERVGLGALLVGYYEDGNLRYAGRVGTGFDHETLKRLHSKLTSLERNTPPFAEGEEAGGDDVHWATPKLVGEVG
ncbi:MAG TPA: non-homologous end-joining DNA ligase, partial [Longimicrobiales bacterium]|nr:non-homologous end-joining DNA ligase [Longimicrobiales bacterium]